MMKEQSPFGIRERFGRLLINTFGKKWDSKPASLKGLEKRDVPRHIAIIMDGNARWRKGDAYHRELATKTVWRVYERW